MNEILSLNEDVTIESFAVVAKRPKTLKHLGQIVCFHFKENFNYICFLATLTYYIWIHYLQIKIMNQQFKLIFSPHLLNLNVN